MLVTSLHRNTNQKVEIVILFMHWSILFNLLDKMFDFLKEVFRNSWWGSSGGVPLYVQDRAVWHFSPLFKSWPHHDEATNESKSFLSCLYDFNNIHITCWRCEIDSHSRPRPKCNCETTGLWLPKPVFSEYLNYFPFYSSLNCFKNYPSAFLLWDPLPPLFAILYWDTL